MRTAGRFPVPADTRPLQGIALEDPADRAGVGRTEAPYYACTDCSKGQDPTDAELGVAGLESSPGVRRMPAVVGSEMPFAPGCEATKLLAGLDVTLLPKPSNAPPRPLASKSPSGTSRKSVVPNNSSCPLVSKQEHSTHEPSKTIRHVLDWPRCHRYHRSALPPHQSEVRGLTGSRIELLDQSILCTFKSHTR
jgi:hypothetical protein